MSGDSKLETAMHCGYRPLLHLKIRENGWARPYFEKWMEAKPTSTLIEIWTAHPLSDDIPATKRKFPSFIIFLMHYI